MASLLLTRGLHSLIVSRESAPVAWSTISRREAGKEHAVSTVLLVVWVAANIVVFLPVVFLLGYTLNRLYPTLAIVEAADSPPDYELVAGKEADNEDGGKVDSGSNSKDTIVADIFDAKGSSAKLMPDETAGVPPTPSQPVTSGVLATLRLLRADGGGLFKAYRWQFLHNLVLVLIIGGLSSLPYMPDIVASIIASLATTKIETAWTHAAISKQRDGRLWKTLPSFFTILKATALPLVAEAVLVEITTAVSYLALGPRTGSADPMGVIPVYAQSGNTSRVLLFLLIFIVLYTGLLIPVSVILTRTRAAMLSDDTTTLVALDSSIRSQNAEELGFISWVQAWKTFSRASWIRIAKVYAKVFATTLVAEFVVLGIIFVQVMVYMANMPKSPDAQ